MRIDTPGARVRPNQHSVPEPEAKQPKKCAKSSPAAAQNANKMQTIFHDQVFRPQGPVYQQDAFEVNAYQIQPSFDVIPVQQRPEGDEELCRHLQSLSINIPNHPRPLRPQPLHLQLVIPHNPNLIQRLDKIISKIIEFKVAIQAAKNKENVDKIIELLLCYATEIEKENIAPLNNQEVIYQLIGEHIPEFFSYLKLDDFELNF